MMHIQRHHIARWLHGLAALFVCFAATASAWAQLSETKTYLIRSALTGKVLSNGEMGVRNASIKFEQEDPCSFGQRWTLKSTGADNTYIIVSTHYPTMAIDAAPSASRPYYAVHWDASTTSQNEQFVITPIDDLENGYIVTWTGNNKRRFMEYANGSLNISDEDDGTGKCVQMLFEETTAEPSGARPRADYNDWENETFFQENKLPAHATFMPYASTEKLHADTERYAHPWVNPTGAEWMSLNGVWNMQWTTDIAKRPTDGFYADDVDASKWDTITVPSCLEMKGYGDPYYINVGYAFADNYPYINTWAGCQNSVASYRRNFNLPEGWESGKRVVLHFDGIYSAAYVWVNGTYVGYTQGANNDAEFDLSNVVRSGNNNISVQVFRFSDASYLEGQDMWHMSGIHRDVYLYATPTTYVRDHVVTDNLAAPYTAADVNVHIDMANPSAQAVSKQVRVRLIAPDGSQVAEQTESIAFDDNETAKESDIALTGLTDLLPWTSETPNLYTVEVAQLAANGTEEMAFATKHGFRKVEIKSGKVYVNGQRVFFAGANTQDTHPLYGRSIDVATMLRDVQMMKQANMNMVRCSHYPRQAKMYSMFDYYGLYCMDEADVECHYNWEQSGNTISKAKSWRAQYLDRTSRMVIRDRNFPSVVFWSLGNESGVGSNLQATYDSTKVLDPTRYVHYEGATRGNASYTDLYSVMYPNISRVKSEANRTGGKPFFMCEFAHSMGNANGNFKEYWDLIRKSTYGMGGCVWDWVDQSICKASDIKSGALTQNGYPKYYTGNDFPNSNHQGNFVNNGLVPADRAWTPKLAEVKAVYQLIDVTAFNNDTKTATVENKYNFTNLNSFKVAYALLKNGEVVEVDTIDAPSAEPGATAQLSVPFKTQISGTDEYLLNFTFLQKEATHWSEAAYPVAQTQCALQKVEPTLPTLNDKADNAEALTIETDRSMWSIGNSLFNVKVNKSSGRFNYWTFGNYSIINNISNSPTYDNFRWVENDEASGNSLANSNGVTSTKLTTDPVLNSDGTVTFTTTQTGSYCDVVYNYKVHTNGAVDMQTVYSPHKVDNLRRIGVKFVLPKTFETVNYYAYGPWENYVDRLEASALGRYNTTVTDMFATCPHPQSCGNHQGLRDLTLADSTNQVALRIEAEGQVAFSALHYDDNTMASARHRWNLTPSNVVLHLDYYQKGIGNGSCGQGTGTLNKYLCPTSGTYTNAVRFTPFFTKDVTGIAKTTANATDITVKVVADQVVCTGTIAGGTQLRVVDLGGATIARTMAASATLQLTASLAGQPHGVYLVLVGNRCFKVIK